MNKKDIGKKIQEFRNLSGITQAELAEAIDMHEKQISRIESGVHFPTFDNFVKILEVLNVSLKDFDMEMPSKCTPLKKKAIKIIQHANEKELKTYTKILETLQKAFE